MVSLCVVAQRTAQDGVAPMQAIFQQGLVMQELERPWLLHGDPQRVVPVRHVTQTLERPQPLPKRAGHEKIGRGNREVAPQQRLKRGIHATGLRGPPALQDVTVHGIPPVRLGEKVAVAIDQAQACDDENLIGSRLRGIHQTLQALGRVAIIRIQDREIRGPGHCQAPVQGGVRAGIGLGQQANAGITVLCRVGLQDSPGIVGGTIVDHDEFPAGEGLGADTVHRFNHILGVVVGRQDHRHQGN